MTLHQDSLRLTRASFPLPTALYPWVSRLTEDEPARALRDMVLRAVILRNLIFRSVKLRLALLRALILRAPLLRLAPLPLSVARLLNATLPVVKSRDVSLQVARLRNATSPVVKLRDDTLNASRRRSVILRVVPETTVTKGPPANRGAANGPATHPPHLAFDAQAVLSVERPDRTPEIAKKPKLRAAP